MYETQLELFSAPAPRIAGELATFARAKHQPLHSWFPYLEGYSVEFVEALRAEFLPNARHILDPFAGTGTTPLHLSSVGIRASYCEVNPAMRFIIETKAMACHASQQSRRITAGALEDLASQLPRRIRTSSPSPTLRHSYEAAFDGSEFFDVEAFEVVLRLKTLCDRTKGFAGRLLTVAALATLVPCSRLKRAGDLRFKTEKELAQGTPPVVDELLRRLFVMVSDLPELPTIQSLPSLVTSDAKQLDAATHLQLDGVITSPPYLNGTNYIRNTRLELWFLGYLTQKRDLRTMRDGMVTAGINDVASGSRTCDHPEVAALCTRMEQSAYDQRIPKMVSAYFADMDIVFDRVARQSKPGASICLDIGDSQYGGIHVPTHELLARLLERRGFAEVSTVPLRARTSKDGTSLRQEVLVFQKRTAPRTRQRHSAWKKRWEQFKVKLPHQQAPYSSRNWGHSMHSACSYHGKLKPSVAHFLVEAFTNPGDLVVDPFAGAGTVPLEAALQGRSTFSLDLGTLAYCVTSAKVRPPEPEELTKRVQQLGRFLKRATASRDELDRASSVRFNGPLNTYYHAETFAEIVLARRHLLATRDDTPEWASLMCALLHVLHGNRPYALSRRSHPVTPFAPTGPAIYKSVIEKVAAKLERMASEPVALGQLHAVAQGDACAPWPLTRHANAIITSPPFFDSTRFYMFNWIRFWFSGWEAEDFKTEPSRFLETRQKASMNIYSTILARCRESLANDGILVLHLGRSKKCDMGKEIAARAGKMFSVIDLYSEDVSHCESHGVSDKGTIATHQYLVLQPR